MRAEGRETCNMHNWQLDKWQNTTTITQCTTNYSSQPKKCFWWLIAKQVTNKCLSCSWTLHNNHTVHTLSEMPQVVWITLWFNCKSEVLSWGSCLHDHSTLVVVGITCSLQSSTWTADTSSGGLHVAQLLQEANVDHPAEAWSCRKER